MAKSRYTNDQLQAAVAESSTIAEVLRRLGLVPCGGNYENILRRARRIDVNVDHLITQRRKRARVEVSEARFREAVAESETIAQVLRSLGLDPTIDYEFFHRKRQEYGVDVSHFTGQAWRSGRRSPRPLAELLRNGTEVQSSMLKQRLFEEGVKERCCERCGITEWQGEEAPLELDHVNGDRNDNRLQNLRVLCPNCHALTPTYRSRNLRYARSRSGA